MSRNADPQVIVVGAGPVGLATALTLHQRGVKVQVVERDDRAGTHSYALALHPETVDLLEGWGLGPRLRRASTDVDQLAFCDHSGPRFELDLRKVRNRRTGLLVAGQDHLESALIGPLEAAGVPVHWSHRLAGLKQDANGVELELERLSEGMSGYAMARLEWQVDREISTRAAYVVGADGHFSMVRRKLGIEFPKVAPTQSLAVFEFKSDFDHGNKAHIVFGEEGTSVLWPLPGGYCRWDSKSRNPPRSSIHGTRTACSCRWGHTGITSLRRRCCTP
jgi:2-polyprenyl-6-methoxyphenol hydroxylase-like FAD-dependent oxidoreductase